MAAFLFTLLAAFVTALGARDQVLIASLAARRGAGIGLLATALAVAVFSAGIAGWAGELAAPLLTPRARTYLVAMALALAALELLVLRPRRPAGEPTESFGALAVVLLAHEVTDAARLLIFAIAAASANSELAALGGVFGCAASVALGWGAGDILLRLPLVRLRAALGVVLALVALYLAA